MTESTAPDTGPSTRERILDAAERLFAENGIEGTSLREITGAAGVNLAAVHYHFGSKEALVGAVFDALIGPINRERLRQLDALEGAAAPGVPDLESVLLAFVGPALQATSRDDESISRKLSLVGRIYAERRSFSREVFVRQFQTVFQRFHRALARCLPHLAAAEVSTRMHLVIGSLVHMVHTMGDPVTRALLGVGAVELGTGKNAAREMARLMVPFLAAGLRAPAAPPSLHEVR